MAQEVGAVSVWRTADGRAFVDDEEVGALLSRSERQGILRGAVSRRVGTLAVRDARIDARIDRVRERQGGPAGGYSPEQAYQQAIASGMVNENQYEGLGYGTLTGTAGATLSLSNTVNRSIWIKSFVAQCALAAGTQSVAAVVTSITIAGIPINIGSSGTPIAMFFHDATRFGMSFGRKLAAVGQQVAMTFENQLAVAQYVQAGAIGDELNPFVQQQVMQMQLLQAAASGFSGFGG